MLRGFARPNLHLVGAQRRRPERGARPRRSRPSRRRWATRAAPRGGAIVYAATRRQTEQWAELLREQRLERGRVPRRACRPTSARGSRRASRTRSLDVVVATNAFGMGIDRADIRAVVHVQPPVVDRGVLPGGRARGPRRRRGPRAPALLGGRHRAAAAPRDDGHATASPAPPELAARAWGLFRELLRYLDARTCRHDFILRYFGDERELLGGCGHCDVCAALDDGAEAPRRRRERERGGAGRAHGALGASRARGSAAGLRRDRRDAPRRRQRAHAALRLHRAVDVRPAARAPAGLDRWRCSARCSPRGGSISRRPSTPCRCSRAPASR